MKWWQRPEALIAALGAGAVLFLERRAITETVSDVFERGKRVSYGTLDDELGIILEAPEALRAAASQRMGIDIPLDVYSAARMIRSEGAAHGAIRLHTALNDLGALGWKSLHYLLTYSTDPLRKGIYGKQWSKAVPPHFPRANARRYATSANPYEGDVRTAFRVIEDRKRGIDPTRGAVKFIDKSSMGVQEGSRSFEEVNAAWQRDGLVAYNLPGLPADLVLYRKA